MPKHEVKNKANQVTITLDGDTAAIFAGGDGQEGGNLILRNMEGKDIIFVGELPIIKGNPPPQPPTVFPGNGLILLKDSNSNIRIQLDAASSHVLIGGNDADGDLILKDKTGNERTKLSGTGLGTLHTGSIVLINGSGEQGVFLNSNGRLVLGGNGTDGAIYLVPSSASGRDITAQANVSLDGNKGTLTLKQGFGSEAAIAITNILGHETITLSGHQGRLTLKNISGENTISLDGSKADLVLGGANKDGAVIVRNGAGKDTIRLDGEAGDILLANADCAEDFDVVADHRIEPGTVLVLNDEGKLMVSNEAYDHRVAGVVSGAGVYNPGLRLDHQPNQQNRQPIALVGKTYCKVDASYNPIKVGDLLTTSQTAGHAMRAIDPLCAFGAVIGKALRPLNAGQGIIPILIALQ